MISIDKAKKLIRERRLERQTESIPIMESAGTYLARQLTAPFDSPRFDNSAMDGYAVRWVDIQPVAAGENVTLDVSGESKAGSPWDGTLEKGEAVQINTGAAVPDGADTVVPVEHCKAKGNRVMVYQVRSKGNHIRRKGEEYRQGDLLLAAGKALNPATVGLLAGIGKEMAEVYKPPRVTLMVTGSELTGTGEAKPGKGQIYDSNRPMLYQYLKLAGVERVNTVCVGDEEAATEQAIRKARDRSDIIISTGGVSVGPHDHIPAAAQKAGFEPVFHHVAQKPGKPFFFATSVDVLYFGLPGNPVSAFMTFTWYIYPELCFYIGSDQPFKKRRGKLTHDITNDRNRSVMMRMSGAKKEGTFKIKSVTQQGSHMVQALTQANGFIIVPPATRWDKEQRASFYFFPWQYHK